VQTAVVQITLQLQSDAENVSGLTNRVAQIIRDRDEVKTIQFSHESVYI
jgi:cell division protein FtsX